MTDRKGYSILELLIIVMIIAVLVGIAIYSYFYFYHETKVVKSKEELAGLVQSVNLYYATKGKFPSELKQTVGHNRGNLPTSPFGSKYTMNEAFVYTRLPNGRVYKKQYRAITSTVTEKMKQRALREMKAIAVEIYKYYKENGVWPDYISQLGKMFEKLLGPWDFKYYIEDGFIKTQMTDGTIVSYCFTNIEDSEFKRQLAGEKSDRIIEALEKFHEKEGHYPSELEELIKKRMLERKALISPWGTPFGIKGSSISTKIDDGSTFDTQFKDENELKSSNLTGEVEDDYVKSLPKDQIRAIELSSDKKIWVATWGSGVGVKHEEKDVWKFHTTRDGLASNYVYSIAFENDVVWIGSFEGVSRLKDGKIINYDKKSGLPDERITSITVDYTGTKWLGSWKKGVFTWKNGRVTRVYGSNFGLKGPVYKIHIDSHNTKWLGSWEGGLVRLKNEGYWSIFDINNGLYSNHIMTMIEKGDTLWVGTWGGGIVVLDTQTGKIIKTYNHQHKNNLPHDDVEILGLDFFGNVWAGFGNGIVGKLEGESWQVMELNETSSNGFGITSIKLDFSGNVWVGTWGNGLLKYGGYE
ncbi:hypothetical protein KAJ27_03570 [bacterium]|nr:hypothetical protein [bacterium]